VAEPSVSHLDRDPALVGQEPRRAEARVVHPALDDDDERVVRPEHQPVLRARDGDGGRGRWRHVLDGDGVLGLEAAGARGHHAEPVEPGLERDLGTERPPSESHLPLDAIGMQD
jgi:hypothetical protein